MSSLQETLAFLNRVPSLVSQDSLSEVSAKISSLKSQGSALELQSVYRAMKRLRGPSSELLSLVFH